MCPSRRTFERVPLGPDGAKLSVPRFSPEWWQAWTMPLPETGCHIWLGSICKQGYGRIWFDGQAGNPAQRVRYLTTIGPIAEGLKVCHSCDVPSCVNPDHLFLGTQTENMRDMFAKRRARPQGKAWGDRKEQILALIAERPEISRREIASELNLTYNYVGLICRNEGISVTRRTWTGRPWVTDSKDGAA